MKWMIASDLHGSARCCREMLEALRRESADRLVLLGDLLYHGPRNDFPEEYDTRAVTALLNGVKDRLLCVRGNCDSEVDQMILEFPMQADYALLNWEGLTLYAANGHLWNEDNPPLMTAGTVLLNGHFHLPAARSHDGWHYINPGSTSIPKDGSTGSYLILENRVFTWKDMDGTPYQTYTPA